MDSNWFQQDCLSQDWEQQGWQQQTFGRPLPTDSNWLQQDWRRDWEQRGLPQEIPAQPSVSLEERRGRSRPVSPATSPKHITETHGRDSESHSTSWRNKQHRYEDHAVLRCPWPGGRETFGEPERWLKLQSEACNLGLVSLSAHFLDFFFNETT